jgi:hypothetical protein
MKKNILNNLMAAFVIVLAVGIGGSGNTQEIEFQKNPNNLENCFKSSNLDFQEEQYIQTKFWDKCWARFHYYGELFVYGENKNRVNQLNGYVYEGEWKLGLPNGYGQIQRGRQYQYVGNFVNGMKDGKGKELNKDLNGKNNLYIGDFKNNKKNGSGIENYDNKESYEGEFKEDKKSGKGIFKFSNGNFKEGIWEKNILVNEIKVGDVSTKNKLEICPKPDYSTSGPTWNWHNCWGVYEITYGKNNKGDIYEGEWVNGVLSGLGILIKSNGTRFEGIWEKGVFLRSEKINLPNISTNQSANRNNKNIEREYKQSAEERKKFEEEKPNREQARTNQRVNLQVTNTQPDDSGVFNIAIETNADTASLKINDEEQGGRADGNYTIKKVARAGQETKFIIVATDINGNTDSKTIAVTRQVTASSQIKFAELNPSLVKTQPNKDAVAIIIGIADYKNLPRADYANDDARAFYDYAMRGLGVRAENIKLLVDGDAGQGEILKTFKTWLPSRVKSTTDVYVYYSGHGLPSADGQTFYLLPQQADRDLIEDTAVAQSRINAAIQAAKPKSVTIFLDSCYSGAARTGQTLIASARPISLKANSQTFPSDFTVFTASTADQISSSSNELKHGIFSYYLMRGMEGDADTNKDGKITAGEMQTYLTENVAKQASLANRLQQPQLAGDANRVLVGR